MNIPRQVVFAFSSICLYAIQNVAVEERLSRFSVLALIALFSSFIFCFSLVGLGIMKSSGQQIVFPPVDMLLLISGIVFINFLGDVLYIGTYTSGGSAYLVSIIVALFPVATFVVKYFTAGTLPNKWYVLGCVFAIGAAMCVAKGSGSVS